MDIEELIELGSRCRAAKDFAGALKHYLRALEMDPEDRSILLALGDVYRGLNDYESSLEVWTRGIQDHPKDVAILTRIADAHKRLGHRDPRIGAAHTVVFRCSDDHQANQNTRQPFHDYEHVCDDGRLKFLWRNL